MLIATWENVKIAASQVVLACVWVCNYVCAFVSILIYGSAAMRKIVRLSIAYVINDDLLKS